MPNIDTKNAGATVVITIGPVPPSEHEGKPKVQLEVVQSNVSALASTGAATIESRHGSGPEHAHRHERHGHHAHHAHKAPGAGVTNESGPPAAAVASAAHAMDKYMGAKHLKKVDVGDLYKLSTDASAPKAAREAAKFFLAHPKAYEKIETSDVAGADGISGRANFHKAAGSRALVSPAPAKAEIAVIKTLEGEVSAVSALASPSHQSSLSAAQAVLKKMEDPSYMPTPAEFAAVMAYKNAAEDKTAAAGPQVAAVVISGGGASASPALTGASGLSEAAAAAQAQMNAIQAQMAAVSVKNLQAATSDGAATPSTVISGSGGLAAATGAAQSNLAAMQAQMNAVIAPSPTLESSSGPAVTAAPCAVAPPVSTPIEITQPIAAPAPVAKGPVTAGRQVSNTEKAFNDLSTLLAGNSAQAAKQTDQVLYSNQAAATGVSVPRPAPTGGEVATAAGTLAKYQSDNGITLMNVNDVYELSRNPNVSPEVRNAAKFMVENPDIYRDIEVKGKATPDQVNSVGEMQQTARELAGDTKPYVPKSTSPAIDATPTQANVATAANSLVQHMKDTGVEELNATDLNKLAYDPTVSEDVRKAAKFMLQNTDVYAALEAQSAAAGPRPAPTRGEVASAATTLGNYQSGTNGGVRTPEDLYNLSRDASAPEDVRKAAKFMIENPDVYRDIEVGDWATVDGISSSHEMLSAAAKLKTNADKPYVSTAASSIAIASAPSAEGTATALNTLGAYMQEKGKTELNRNDLNALLYSPDSSDDVKRAAKYMLQNSDVYESAVNASAAPAPAPA